MWRYTLWRGYGLGNGIFRRKYIDFTSLCILEYVAGFVIQSFVGCALLLSV